MKKLSKYFNDSSVIDADNITIYNFYLEKKFDELIEMAKELDEKYKTQC